MPEGEIFLYRDGLKRLAGSLDGDETVLSGIRPYGMHSGNVLAMIVYRQLLGEAVEAAGNKVSFRNVITLMTGS